LVVTMVHRYKYDFGHYPSSYQLIGTSSVDWPQLSRFHLKMETESSLRNVVF
jgi:hypothetical protein